MDRTKKTRPDRKAPGIPGTPEPGSAKVPPAGRSEYEGSPGPEPDPHKKIPLLSDPVTAEPPPGRH